MKDRIIYIDSLKGIAILLVIIGHCIAMQFSDYREALDGPKQLMFLWKFIYSFHMPLFAFCSGLLMAKAKEFYTLKNVGNTLLRRIKSLLIPFAAVGSIWYVINGQWGDHYWFLIIMWECIIVHLAIGFVCSFIPKWSEHVETVVLLIVAILSLYVYNYMSRFNVFPIIDFSRFHHLFPYYVVGIIATRYKLVERVILKQWVYGVALLLFVVLTYLKTYMGYTLPLGKISNRIIPIAAICVTIYWCNCADFIQSKANDILSNLGKHSLELYLIHFFFPLQILFIGDWSMKLCKVGGYSGGFMIFLLQLLAASTASIVVIIGSYGVMWVLGKSPILSQVFLGRKYE